MHPILFQLGPLTIYTYGVLVATGVMLTLWIARRQAPRAGLDPVKVWNVGIYGILAALLGAKLWLIASEWDYYSHNPRQIFSSATLASGGTFYGGLAGAILTLVLYAYFQKMPALPLMDTYAAAFPVGHAIGRLGCFAAGCCFGKPTTLPWGVTFTSPDAARLSGTPLGVPLHPTQLYESGAEFLNFILLLWLGGRQRFKGQLTGAYMILYGIERGTIEFFRNDPDRTMLFHGAFSLMQIVSVGLILAGGFLWWRGLRGAAPITPVAPARAAAERS
jgi:phosphatidylglycerol---prolipoprotein diacylglyceryl transferase